jgi:hypothetical protein
MRIAVVSPGYAVDSEAEMLRGYGVPPIGPRPLERTDGVAVHSFESGVPGGNTGRDTSSP